ncbi:hypothetical protein G9A89_005226 [Geosiphon pyriformis]|nr:hypothetical protein G9A89_005226 [Geosiphon pyriformis]
MAVPILPADCVGEIVGHLHEDNSSLHSCILVNRLWCENGMRFLWRQPFRLAKLLPINRQISLIDTYLSCLSADEKTDLFESERVYVPSLTNSSPAFNYPELLRHLSIENLYLCVSKWVDKNKCEGVRSSHSVKVLCQELRSLFMRRSPILDSLSLDMVPDDRWPGFPSFLYYSEAETWLYRLREFAIIAPLIKWGVFDDLARHTIQLRKLTIYLVSYPRQPTEARSLAGFIQAQKGLEHFKLVNHTHLSQNNSRVSPPIHLSVPVRLQARQNAPIVATPPTIIISQAVQANHSNQVSGPVSIIIPQLPTTFTASSETRCLPIILSALLSQYATLTQAEFVGLKFNDSASLSVLSNCCKLLESIELSRCHFPRDLSVNSSWLPQELPALRKIYFSPVDPVIDDVYWRLVRKTNINLKELCIRSSTTLCQDTFSMLVVSISRHCPNLFSLALPVHKNGLSRLCELFHSFSQLERLTLFINGQCDTLIEDEDNKAEDDVSGFLPKLGLVLPLTLRYLDVELPWWFTAGSLESFLINSKAPLETLKFRNSPCISDQHQVVIMFYLNDTLVDKDIVNTKKSPLLMEDSIKGL